MKAKFIEVYFGADLRISHEGIKKLLEDDDIEVKKGQYVLLFNNRRTHIKIACGTTGVILSYRSPHVIDPAVIPYIPEYINGHQFDMTGALTKRIDDYFKRKGQFSK